MPSQRKNEYWILNSRGSSTKTAYIDNAGITNNQPMMVSQRTILCGRIRRERAGATGPLSDLSVDVTVDLLGAGIFTRPSPLLRQFPLVLSLNGLEKPSSVLLTADHLLELRRPPLGEDGTRRVRDEVHRGTGLADHRPGSERLVGDRAGGDRRHRGIRRPTRVGAANGHIDQAGLVVGGDP